MDEILLGAIKDIVGGQGVLSKASTRNAMLVSWSSDLWQCYDVRPMYVPLYS
jgi:hypothetical protein